MSDKRLMSIKFKGIDQTYIIPTVIADDANNDGNVVVKNYPSEAYAQHSVDKANPHSVTAEQVGAAPATEVQGSYTVADAADLDSTLTSIINSMELSSRRTIHIVYQETTPINKGDWFMTISKTADENYGSVEAIHDYAIGILKKYRSYYSGAWTDWVNIPDHTHAPADIGAAPSGYGLGDICTTLSANEITKTGWYKGSIGSVTGDTWGANADFWIIRHIEHGVRNEATQKAWMPACYGNCSIERVRSEGVWGEWEWVNPRLELGVEYRTTERWLGKPVYTMMVDCGAAANAKTTTPNIGNGTIFKFVGRTVGYALPMLHTGLSSTYMMYLYCDNSSVTIMCGSAMVGKQTYCQIWYYKD